MNRTTTKLNRNDAQKSQNGMKLRKKKKSRRQPPSNINEIISNTREQAILSTSEICTEKFAVDFLNESQSHPPEQYTSNPKPVVYFTPSSFCVEREIIDAEERQKPNRKTKKRPIPPKHNNIKFAKVNPKTNNHPGKKRCIQDSINATFSESEQDFIDAEEYVHCSSAEEDDIEFSFLRHNTNEITQEEEHVFRITLYREAIVYIHGLISIRVLEGSVQILGYTHNASDQYFDIYSPAGSSLLSINNCTQNNSSDTAIILCKKLDTVLSQSLSLYAPKNIFPSLQNNGTQCIVNSSAFFEKNYSLFTPSPKWDDFASTLSATSRTIITGSKGTGKSTLLRYLVNRLLGKDREDKGHPIVLVIDLDPGQPEFTPPGCISIVMVKSPLLGPSYTHQQIPEKCVHISNVDIKYNMDEYIRSCKYLLSLMEEFPNIPTLVNYIGFSRGLGQELISTIISFTNPTTVVQLNDPDGKYNYSKDLTIENVIEDAKWLPDSRGEINLKFQLVKFESVHNYNKLNSIIYTPGQFREIAIATYFSSILKGVPLCLTDLAVRIHLAPLDKIKIQDSLGNSHPAICNANLVSLCRKVSIENKEIFNCLGWGVVRCLSIPRNAIYLITPLHLDLLEQIECVVVSSIRLPIGMYLTTAKDISGQIPYIEDGQQSDLEKPSKRQHYSWEKANQ